MFQILVAEDFENIHGSNIVFYYFKVKCQIGSQGYQIEPSLTNITKTYYKLFFLEGKL